MTRAEDAIAQDDEANALADRFTRWARWVLGALLVIALVGTPAVITIATVLVHQSSTLDKQAGALADDRKASEQRDTVVAQQRELLDKQDRFDRLLADLLAAKSLTESNAIREQIGAQFGSNAPTTTTTVPPAGSSSSSSTTTTTTRPSSSPTTTTPPPRPTPTTTTSTTMAPPAPIPAPLPPFPIGPVCAVLPVCPSASGVQPFVTFGP